MGVGVCGNEDILSHLFYTFDCHFILLRIKNDMGISLYMYEVTKCMIFDTLRFP